MWRCKYCGGKMKSVEHIVVESIYDIKKNGERREVSRRPTIKKRIYDGTWVGDVGDFFRCSECGNSTGYMDDKTLQDIAKWEKK